MILRRFIYYCGKFHPDTINQTVFTKEFVKLVWGNTEHTEHSLCRPLVFNQSATNTQSLLLNSSKFDVSAVSAMIDLVT